MGYKNTNEFMRIRGVILSSIANSNRTEIRIPSLRKLAELYRVSPPTAMRAIHSLLEDGYIVPLKGGGYRSLSQMRSSMKIFGMINSFGKQIYDIHCFWLLNAALGIDLTGRGPEFCTKDLYLETQTDLRRAIFEHGLAGLICSGVTAEIVDEIVRLQKETPIPAVAFYTSTRKITAAAPLAEDFYGLFRQLLREKRTRFLVLLSEHHPFYREIAEAIEKTRFQNGVSLTRISCAEEEALFQLRTLYRTTPSFDAILFFSLMPGTYEFLAKRENPDQCRFVLDQFSLYESLRFTGYVYSIDLKKTAGKIIGNLLEQTRGNENKHFFRTEFSIVQYENGHVLKPLT